MINPTPVAEVPAEPRRRQPDTIEFLRFAGSIGGFDVVAFGFALRELMSRRGCLVGDLPGRSSLTDAELWGNVESGLNWLETLYELAPEGGEGLTNLQNRIESNDADGMKRAMEAARNRAKWCGGMPLWLVCVNVVAALFCTLTAAVVLVRGPSVVEAGPPIDYATPAEIRALGERLDTLQDDHAFVVGRLMDKIEQLEAVEDQDD